MASGALCRVHPVKRVMIAGALALFCLLQGPPPAAAQSGSVYVIANLAIEADAKDAVAAKKKAMAEGQRRAMNILMRRIAPFGAYDRLPTPKLSIIEELIEGFSVQRESNSATRYLATLDITFQSEAVRQYLNGYGVAYSETQAPALRLLPVFVQDGKIVRSTANPWRKAWRGLDLRNTVTPVKLAAVGESVTSDVVNGLMADDDSAYETLSGAYKSERLVVALASYNAGDAKLSTRFYGLDAGGTIKLTRTDRVWGGDLKASANHAAMVALRVFEGRWKMLKSPNAVAGAGEAAGAFALRVEFAGMQQWQKMRARLTRVPGVQALEVTSLSARSADVTMQYPGGAERLASQISAYNLYLENLGEGWILREN